MFALPLPLDVNYYLPLASRPNARLRSMVEEHGLATATLSPLAPRPCFFLTEAPAYILLRRFLLGTLKN